MHLPPSIANPRSGRNFQQCHQSPYSLSSYRAVLRLCSIIRRPWQVVPVSIPCLACLETEPVHKPQSCNVSFIIFIHRNGYIWFLWNTKQLLLFYSIIINKKIPSIRKKKTPPPKKKYYLSYQFGHTFKLKKNILYDFIWNK